MELENKIFLIENQIRKAQETIEDARISIQNGRYRNALNRIYYSIFYIVTALAIKHDFATSKHKQLMGWFNKNFLKEALIDLKYGEIYKKAFDNRQESDYDVIFDYDKSEVESLYGSMIEFVDEIHRYIKNG